VGQIGHRGFHNQILNIAAVICYNFGYGGERPRLIDNINCQTRWKPVTVSFLNIPSYIEPAIGLVVKRFKSRRLDRKSVV